MRRIVPFALLVALSFSHLPAGTTRGEAEARARQFGAALTSGDAAGLRPILPAKGKVRVALSHLADTGGAYGSSQVEALFRDALARSRVRSFETLRVESDESSFALIQCRASVVDREGGVWKIALHLSLQPEAGAWVVREIRESAE